MTWILSGFTDEAADPSAEQLRVLRDVGLQYVDLRALDGDNISTLPHDDIRTVKAALDQMGATVNMLGSPIGKSDATDPFEPDLDKLEHLATTAEILGCNQVRVFSYFNKTNLPLAQWQAISLERLSQLKDRAAPLGLVLFHENERHIFGDRLEQVKVLADTLGDGQTFKFIFDFDNFNQSGDDCWENWLALREQTDSFHLKDSDSEGQHVPIGEGAGQAERILADALARGWDGPLSLEPHLAHSAAVMATGPSGRAYEKTAGLTPQQCFAYATDAARKLLDQIGAAYE